MSTLDFITDPTQLLDRYIQLIEQQTYLLTRTDIESLVWRAIELKNVTNETLSKRKNPPTTTTTES